MGLPSDGGLGAVVVHGLAQLIHGLGHAEASVLALDDKWASSPQVSSGLMRPGLQSGLQFTLVQPRSAEYEPPA